VGLLEVEELLVVVVHPNLAEDQANQAVAFQGGLRSQTYQAGVALQAAVEAYLAAPFLVETYQVAASQA
jgi:hypothetical protein